MKKTEQDNEGQDETGGSARKDQGARGGGGRT
jgi:hypothetical protein